MNDRAYYLTDDRDLPEEDLRALVIQQGGNGDWYVSVTGKSGYSTEGVRLCTSGGASSKVPGLTVAIANAYRAIKDAEEGKRDIRPSYSDLEMEILAWRSRFPSLEFDRFDIVEKPED
jgi:hypothetical protein